MAVLDFWGVLLRFAQSGELSAREPEISFSDSPTEQYYFSFSHNVSLILQALCCYLYSFIAFVSVLSYHFLQFH